MKSFILGQVVLETRNCRPALSPSNLPAAIAINDRAVSCDHQRLVKRELPSFGKCRQSRRRNREPMSLVSGVRAELFDTTSHKPALKPVRLRPVVARFVSVRFHGVLRLFCSARVKYQRSPKSEKGLERSPVPLDEYDFELCS
jgi:hypothetical protein